MAKRRVSRQPADPPRLPSLGDLHCDVDRLTAVLITIDQTYRGDLDPADSLLLDDAPITQKEREDLASALMYELLPLAIRSSRVLAAELQRLEEHQSRPVEVA